MSETRLNCEVLHDESALEIRWSVVGSGETIVFQLVGRIDEGNYMAFGLSGESDRSVMLGGDVAVGWLDEPTGKGHVVDYYLERKSVCIGNAGSCPDVQWKEGTNNVRMLSAASVNGFTILTYQRKLGAADIYDKPILTNGSQPVIWAVGPIKNGEAQYHFLRNKDDLSIDFGRLPKWNCPEPEGEPESSQNSPSPATILLQSTQTAAAAASSSSSSSTQNGDASSTTTIITTTTPTSFLSTGKDASGRTTERPLSSSFSSSSSSTPTQTPTTSQQTTPAVVEEYKAPATAPSPASWAVPPIPCYEPDDRVYYAQLGPTGGTYGYRTITGRHEKPQEAWYINGLLLPEIYLVRNLNYTFVIQGGDNPDVPSDYNPFYITDDPEGGHKTKSLIERQGVNAFAGVELDSRGRSIATAVGKLCRWMENGNQAADFFTSYAAYQRSLFLNCDKGHSGILHFTPTQDTPDLLYYQSFTQSHLGWKIHVVDKCGSESTPGRVEPLQEDASTGVGAAAAVQQQLLQAANGSPLQLVPSQLSNVPLASGQIVQMLERQEGASLPMTLHHQQQHHHLGEQSRSPDQRPGESVNQQSVVLPIGDSKTILNSPPVVTSISGVGGSGRPIENAYLFAASSGTAIPPLSPVMNVQQQQQQQHQHQLGSIISLDPNRVLINAKPDGGVPQYASLQGFNPPQGHTLLQMAAAQPDAFHFPHNGPFYQVTTMDAAPGSGGNRIQTLQQFSPPTYHHHHHPLPHQLNPLTEGHLIRRAGPPNPPQALTSGPIGQYKYETRPAASDYYMGGGSNRAQLISHAPLRYDNQFPMHPVVYEVTGAPPVSRGNNGSPMMTGAGGVPLPSQNTLVRFQDTRMRSQVGGAAEVVAGSQDGNLKYVEVPMPSHGMLQTRNLPKREQKHPFFLLSQFGKKERSRSMLRPVSRSQRDKPPTDTFEMGKMNGGVRSRSRNYSPRQSPAWSQRSGPTAQGPLGGGEDGRMSRAGVEMMRKTSRSTSNEGLLRNPRNDTAKCNSTEDSNGNCKQLLVTSNLPLSQEHPPGSSASLQRETGNDGEITLLSSSTSSSSSSSAKESGRGAQVVDRLESQRMLVEVEEDQDGGDERHSQSEWTTTKSTNNHGNDRGDHEDEKMNQLTTTLMGESGGVSGRNGTSSTYLLEDELRPVYETFSPVFRPSPMDIDGFNVSVNFGAVHNQASSTSPALGDVQDQISSASGSETVSVLSAHGLQSHHHPPPPHQHLQFTSGKRKFRHPQLLANIGFPSKVDQRREVVGPREKALSAVSSLPSANKMLLNGGASHNNNPTTFPSFSSVPFANDRIPAGLLPLPSSSHFHDAIKLFNFPGYRHPRPNLHHLQQQQHHHHQQQQQQHPYYLLQQHQQQLRHSQKLGGNGGSGGGGSSHSIHFPIFPIPSRKRLPGALPAELHQSPLVLGSVGNGANNSPTSSSSSSPTRNNGPSVRRSSNGGAGGGGHNAGITSRNDQFPSHSAPAITLISTPDLASSFPSSSSSSPSRLISSPETSDMLPTSSRSKNGASSTDFVFHDLSEKTRSPSSSSSWTHVSNEDNDSDSEEDVDRTGASADDVASPSLSPAATTGGAGASSEENLIKSRTPSSPVGGNVRPRGNTILWRRRQQSNNSTTLLPPAAEETRKNWSGARKEPETKSENADENKEGEGTKVEESETEDDSEPAVANDEPKRGTGPGEGGGEEEGTDPLSLTLLTDIWQTINQDNGAKGPSQKPPAAVPPPHPGTRYLQNESRLPIPPPRMLANGGRNSRPQMLFHLRRQRPLLPPHSQGVQSLSPALRFGQRAVVVGGNEKLPLSRE